MLIASPCCRNNTKSTGFTAKTCGSGRMPCNIKQLLLIFAQTLWRSEPRTFISMAESEPLPRAKFCCIKCFMSSLLLCVHCICMCWSMFMYVGMCTRACIWKPDVVFLNYSPPYFFETDSFTEPGANPLAVLAPQCSQCHLPRVVVTGAYHISSEILDLHKFSCL